MLAPFCHYTISKCLEAEQCHDTFIYLKQNGLFEEPTILFYSVLTHKCSRSGEKILMTASCSCKGKNKTATERSRNACARCLLRHCLYPFNQYVNHRRKWKRPSLSHSVLQSFRAWPGGITSEGLERLIRWVSAVPQVPKFQFSVVGECVSNFASTQEAQTFLFQWLLCQRLGQDLKRPCRWQLEMWHVVAGTRRYVSAIQSRAFEILLFVLLLTAGGF